MDIYILFANIEDALLSMHFICNASLSQSSKSLSSENKCERLQSTNLSSFEYNKNEIILYNYHRIVFAFNAKHQKFMITAYTIKHDVVSGYNRAS